MITFNLRCIYVTIIMQLHGWHELFMRRRMDKSSAAIVHSQALHEDVQKWLSGDSSGPNASGETVRRITAPEVPPTLCQRRNPKP